METTIEHRGFKIRIEQDHDPCNPREWDNLGKMVCDHGRYTLGDEQTGDMNEFALDLIGYSYGDRTEKQDEWWDSLDEDDQHSFISKKFGEQYLWLPLYLYDHSGVGMNTGGFSCPWDSAQVGFIYVSKADIRKEYGWKRITAAREEQIYEYLKGEVETYSQYLDGDVWGYIIEDPDDEDEELDSCWGFFGTEYCIEEAKSMVDYYADERKKSLALVVASAIAYCNGKMQLQ